MKILKIKEWLIRQRFEKELKVELDKIKEIQDRIAKYTNYWTQANYMGNEHNESKGLGGNNQ